MKLYKITDEKNQTWNKCQWGENISHKVSGKGNLCSDGWIHAYEHPLLAVLHNPIHGNYDPETMHLWECKTTDNPKRDGQLKLGVRNLTTIKQIPLPAITIIQKVAYGILCAKEVYTEESWNKWADNWLSGKDRTEAAARATWVASTTAWVASAESAAAWAAESAAWSAAWAAEMAAWSAVSAATRGVNLIEIAEKAMLYS